MQREIRCIIKTYAVFDYNAVNADIRWQLRLNSFRNDSAAVGLVRIIGVIDQAAIDDHVFCSHSHNFRLHRVVNFAVLDRDVMGTINGAAGNNRLLALQENSLTPTVVQDRILNSDVFGILNRKT